MFASMIKSKMKSTRIYAADVKGKQHFQDKYSGGLRIKNVSAVV